MARSTGRSHRNRDASKSDAAVGAHRDESASPSDKSTARGPWAIFGGFALLSIVIVVVSIPGFRLQQATQKANRAFAEGRWSEAAEHLEYLTQKYPRAWIRFKELGDSYLALNRGRDALEAFETSLRIHPDQQLDAKFGRAYYLIDPTGPKATRYFRDALDRDLNDPETNYYAGLLYMDREDYQRAALCFQRATGDPKYFELSRPYIEEIAQRVLGDS